MIDRKERRAMQAQKNKIRSAFFLWRQSLRLLMPSLGLFRDVLNEHLTPNIFEIPGIAGSERKGGQTRAF